MMAPESKESKAPHGEHTANLAHADASYREAYQYWGYLFKEDKCGTPLLDRLLKGIAETIVSCCGRRHGRAAAAVGVMLMQWP